jgi:integrase
VRIAQPKDGEPIRLVFTKAGEPRYRVRLDTDPHADGRRRQVWTTHRSLSDARSHVEAHRTDRDRGVLTPPDKQTFKAYAERWHDVRSRRVREITARSYKGCLGHAYDAFGSKPLNKVARPDVERVVAELADAGRSKRTSSLTLFVIRSVFEDALHDGLIVRNPAARVEAAGRGQKNRSALSTDDLTKLRKHLASDRLFAVWLLTLIGIRRSEVMGLRWSDIDLVEKTLTIARGRVDVDGKRTSEGPPKTRRGARTLPLPADVLAALRALRQVQLADFGAEQVRSGYVAVDAVGEPMRPERWTDLWKEHCETAGVATVTLHAARHSSVTAMREAGVPDHIVAAWHGHDEYVMRNVYSHADAKGMAAAGETLTAAFSGGS